MAASGPIFQPVGAVDLILVEQVSQSLSELVAFAQVGVVREEALQRLEVRLIDQLGDQAHQAPSQRGFIEQGLGRDFVATQDHAIELPGSCTSIAAAMPQPPMSSSSGSSARASLSHWAMPLLCTRAISFSRGARG